MSCRTRRIVLMTFVLGFALSACARETPVSAPDASALLTASSGPALLSCPTNETGSASGTVTPLGGLVSLDGHSIQIPGGALIAPITLTLTEPASRYMEISIRAGDGEHFQFEAPVLVTISYARCSRSNIEHGPLQVWHIDETTHEPIEMMPGVDDKLTRTVSFWTNHLSGYAIAE
jgi:hypothetical protein